MCNKTFFRRYLSFYYEKYLSINYTAYCDEQNTWEQNILAIKCYNFFNKFWHFCTVYIQPRDIYLSCLWRIIYMPGKCILYIYNVYCNNKICSGRHGNHSLSAHAHGTHLGCSIYNGLIALEPSQFCLALANNYPPCV